MARLEVPAKIAEVALGLLDSSALEDVSDALEKGRLRLDSTAAVRAAVADGRATVEANIQLLQELWSTDLSAFSGPTISMALRACAVAAGSRLSSRSTSQVVWTGPRVEGSFLRSTREVVRELLRNARHELLAIGYWIALQGEGEGIIEEIIGLLAAAVARGVDVKVILDDRDREHGHNNFNALVQAWPAGVPLPEMFAWKLPSDDRYVKLHAKVLVADSTDALVTSANLTGYAMDRNMEMGVRVLGAPAQSIAAHFHRLIDTGVLEGRGQPF